MTIGHGIGLLLIGIPITFVTFYVIFKAEQYFEKVRQKDEDTTTRHY